MPRQNAGRKPSIPPEVRAEVLALREQGMGVPEVAQRLHISPGAVRFIGRYYGPDLPFETKRTARGSKREYNHGSYTQQNPKREVRPPNVVPWATRERLMAGR